MPYRIVLKPAAERDLDRLPNEAAARIERHIDALAREPRPPGVLKMKGDGNLWRVRVGDYRILYEIHDRVLVVLVVRIGHRREVYH